MKTLFDAADKEEGQRKFAPLADRMRPVSFDEVLGQVELVAPHSAFRVLIESGNIPSMIFWGPPGSGKTTLAKLIANYADLEFVELSAATSGLSDVRQVIQEAKARLDLRSRRTVLFLDEIHRFNKSQQDIFLPFVESGAIILVGATTENPSFEVNAALLSRCKVFIVKRIETDDIRMIIRCAMEDPERGYGNFLYELPGDVMEEIIVSADGDARRALNTLELLVGATSIAHDPKTDKLKKVRLELAQLRALLQRSHHFYDKTGEEHYTIISALHKSLRGSDADAALYWLGRMLEGGEDPLYVARRLIRFASEDIGLADPQALVQAVAGYQACHFIGMPECNVILAQVVVYLAKSEKSNALYAAYSAVREDIAHLPNEPVPIHLRNAESNLMKDLGYGKGYKYNPNFKGSVEQDYLPEKLKNRKYLNGT